MACSLIAVCEHGTAATMGAGSTACPSPPGQVCSQLDPYIYKNCSHEASVDMESNSHTFEPMHTHVHPGHQWPAFSHAHTTTDWRASPPHASPNPIQRLGAHQNTEIPCTESSYLLAEHSSISPPLNPGFLASSLGAGNNISCSGCTVCSGDYCYGCTSVSNGTSTELCHADSGKPPDGIVTCREGRG